ncbi:MAG: Clp protease ClpP [Bacteroidales bacterium]|nr:Clp protease ClpP [Bacteroidales bacterium]
MKYDLYINDYIGWPISAHYVRSELEKLNSEEECAVYINSLGGSVSDGLDIRQQFADHGNVTAYIHGMTASSATILAMGAKRIVMGRYSLMLVHHCSQWQDEWGQMNAEDIAQAIQRLQKAQDNLETIDHVVASLYAQRAKRTISEMKNVMTEARWLTAEQALELGLIDDILEEEAPEMMNEGAKARIVACGYPLPQTVAEEKRQSLLEEVKRQFAELRNLFRAESAPAPAQNSTEKNDNSNIITMNKTFTAINALLSVEGVEASGGKFTLTEEQMKAIEARLTEATASESDNKSKIEALETEKGELQARIDAIAKGDGDDTPEVRNEGEEEVIGYASAKANYEKLAGLL